MNQIISLKLIYPTINPDENNFNKVKQNFFPKLFILCRKMNNDLIWQNRVCLRYTTG